MNRKNIISTNISVKPKQIVENANSMRMVGLSEDYLFNDSMYPSAQMTRIYHIRILLFLLMVLMMSCSTSTDSQEQENHKVYYRVAFSEGYAGTVEFTNGIGNNDTTEISGEWKSQIYRVPKGTLMNITVSGTTPYSEVGEEGSLIVQIWDNNEMVEASSDAGEVIVKMSLITGDVLPEEIQIIDSVDSHEIIY